MTFGVPEEFASDGGPPLDSHKMLGFLRRWGVRIRRSSAYYPQSNGRAESAVKSMKRILTTNISQSGSLDTDTVAKALLLHRNTPPPDMGLSPAELLFGRNITDHMPQPIQFRFEWSELADARERAFQKRHEHALKNTTGKTLLPLAIGDAVSIQNQRGNQPLRWDNTGLIVEASPYKQYRILVDGSRRTTLRNRRFIRKIDDNTRNIVDTTPSYHATEHTLSDKGPIPYPATPERPVPLRTPSPVTTHRSSVPATTTEDIPQTPPPSPPHNTPSIIPNNTKRPSRTKRCPIKFQDYVLT